MGYLLEQRALQEYVPQKTWHLKTYIDTYSHIKYETNGCLVSTRHQSSLKTNQISVGPYFLEIREEKGCC